jgi:hypothetical protein
MLTYFEDSHHTATVMPAQNDMPRPEQIEPSNIRLFRHPPWRLRLTILENRSYPKVKIARAAPLTHPSRYICFLDEKDEVITMIADPSLLDPESARIVGEELDQRYLTSVITRVMSVRSEFGVSYWDVETHRGRREFVIQNVAENAQWISDRHLMLIDVDTNRFEIPDTQALDKKSLAFIGLAL